MKRLQSYGIDYRNFVITKTIQLIERILTGVKEFYEKKEIILADKRFLRYIEELKQYEIKCEIT